MTITARFSSICPICKCPISIGAQVNWVKGNKATHTSCGASGAKSSSYSGGTGRRTGCACGSREDGDGQLIPSRHNCRSCNHDA